jgi:predicted amino acid racemase
MFLNSLRRRNRELALAAVRAHQDGAVAPNTYLIDLDAVAKNTGEFARAAAEHGLASYFMAKQYGRNPDVSRAVIAAGIPKAVAVDLQCFGAHLRHEIPVGHIGHLVQPERGAEDAVVAAAPEVVTVFDLPRAERIAAAAQLQGRVQPVLLRVHAPGDFFYFGHAGGFPLEEIEDVAKTVQSLGGLEVTGVTTFPCLLGDPVRKTIEPTHNLTTLAEAARRLRLAGHRVTQVNAPGTTSVRTLETLAKAGATHVEPGNALHGTTPLHVFDEDAPEVPAIVYLSEVGHFVGDDAYVFAAGYYIDKVLGDYKLRALCGRDETALDRVLEVEVAPEGAIHYYCVIPNARRARLEVGDSVVFCFRPQAFVTRGRTQALRGVQAGAVEACDRYDGTARAAEPFG